MSWRAPLRLSVGIWEPATPYLARLAVRNRMPGPGEFARLAGTTIQRLTSGRDVERLEQVAGLHVGVLARPTFVVDAISRTFRVSHETFRLKDRVSGGRRWCPKCVACDLERSIGSATGPVATHRTWWDLTVMAACPLHGVRLEDRCPSCGESQPVLTSDLSRCRCGQGTAGDGRDLRDAFGRYVHARLLGAEHESVPFLDEMTLAEAVPFVERLGLVAIAPPGAEWAKLDVGNLAFRLASGFEMLLDWPRSFRAALDRIVHMRMQEAKASGMLGTYGWIHEFWIPSLDAERAGRVLRAELHRHAVALGIVAEGEDIVGRGTVGGTVSLATASRHLGMGHARTRRLLRERRLIPVGSRPGVAMPIDRSAVEALRSRRVRRLDLVGVRQRLGIGKNQARALADRFVPRVEGDGFAAGWCMDGLDRIIDRLADHAVLVAVVPKGHVPLPEACRSMHRPMHEVVDRILEGNLPCWRTGPLDSIASIFVEPNGLGPSSAVGLIRLKHAATCLSIHHEALLQLARIGGIAGERRPGGWVFQERDLTAFADRHVTAVHLAHVRGMSARRLVAQLAKRGVHPAYGPPACRQIVFERRSVDTAWKG